MDDMNSNGSYVQGLFFVSADLKRAYYSVPIREAERDWLRLRWNQPLQAPGCAPRLRGGASHLYKAASSIIWSICKNGNGNSVLLR